MTVTLTSPVLGKDVGATHTGPEEAWLLAHGYAKQTNYTGPGVADSGPADTTPANDLTSADNREAAPERLPDGTEDPGRLDPAMTPGEPPAPVEPAYDFDAGGINTEPPTIEELETTEGKAAGGTHVIVLGQNLKGTTGVTFGGTAATGLDVRDDGRVEVVTPAHAAGSVDVVVTNAHGSATKTGGFTYTA